MKFQRKIPEEKRLAIIDYFYTHHDNRDAVIGRIFGVTRGSAGRIISEHLEIKMEKINARINGSLTDP